MLAPTRPSCFWSGTSAGIIKCCRLIWTALPHGVSRSGQTWRQSCKKLLTGQRGPQQRAKSQGDSNCTVGTTAASHLLRALFF